MWITDKRLWSYMLKEITFAAKMNLSLSIVLFGKHEHMVVKEIILLRIQ